MSDPLVEQLRETRRALLNGGANGGKCDRADAVAAAVALAGEAVSREIRFRAPGRLSASSAGSSPRTTSTIQKANDDDRKRTIPRFRSETGYVVPETYFSECAEAVAKLDAMIELLAPALNVVESVCAGTLPEEVRAMAADARARVHAAAPAAKRDSRARAPGDATHARAPSSSRARSGSLLDGGEARLSSARFRASTPFWRKPPPPRR